MNYEGQVEDELAAEFVEILKHQGIQNIKLQRLMNLLERGIIEYMCDESYTKRHLAENLGIQRTTLNAKMEKLGIEFP